MRSAAGAPLEGARIQLTDPASGQAHEAWSFGSGADGAFTAEYVPAGNYRVRAVLSGHSFDEVPVTVEVGGASQVNLQAQ